jgi:hypothetical protein
LSSKKDRVLIIVMGLLIPVLVVGLFYAGFLFIKIPNSQQTEVIQLREELASNKALYNSLNDKYEDALKSLTESDAGALTCPWMSDVDYTSGDTVHESIKKYVEKSLGKVITDDWDEIWTDEKHVTEHHFFDVDGFYYVYIVYLDDPTQNYTNGVFDVINECWLNIDINQEEDVPPVSWLNTSIS